jgi:hypothetical protein
LAKVFASDHKVGVRTILRVPDLHDILELFSKAQLHKPDENPG